LGKAPDNKKKKCRTVIPKEWKQLTGPEYKDRMSVGEAQRLWFGFLRVQEQVHRNPTVYRNPGE
jgi:hypothetical protein